MNGILYIKMFFLSVVLTTIFGTVIDRLLPGWDGLVSDVGASGAWIISGIYHIIYAFFIGVGVLLSMLVLKRLRKNTEKISIALASLCAVAIFDISLTIFEPDYAGFTLLMVFLLVLSIVLNIIFTPSIWLPNKSLNLTPKSGAN